MKIACLYPILVLSFTVFFTSCKKEGTSCNCKLTEWNGDHYQYDANGDLSAMLQPVVKRTWVYTRSGDMTVISITDSSNITVKDTVLFNSAGKIIERRQHSFNSNQISSYEYDNMGQLVRSINTYFFFGIIKDTTTYEWAAGNMVKAKRASDSWEYIYYPDKESSDHTISKLHEIPWYGTSLIKNKNLPSAMISSTDTINYSYEWNDCGSVVKEINTIKGVQSENPFAVSCN